MTVEEAIAHPAKFSPSILQVLVDEVYREIHRRKATASSFRTLDPMAGVGRVHQLPGLTFGVELEAEWAIQHPNTTVGDARDLQFEDGTFDCIATSPTYGNRFSDHHDARDGSKRRSYTHTLGRTLSRGNTGSLPYRDDQTIFAPYRVVHEAIWREAVRVLRPGGIFLLNVSNFIAAGEEQHVAAWHAHALRDLGLRIEERHEVKTQRNRHGANREARVAVEYVFRLRKPVSSKRGESNGTERGSSADQHGA